MLPILVQLRRLAKYFKFEDDFNEALTDHFVCSLKREVTQKHLLPGTNTIWHNNELWTSYKKLKQQSSPLINWRVKQ